VGSSERGNKYLDFKRQGGNSALFKHLTASQQTLYPLEKKFLRFEVLTHVLQIYASWDVTPCRLVNT
jgi:hypothetical protein